MSNRLLEMAVAIKGKLDSTYTASLNQALQSAARVEKSFGKMGKAMKDAQDVASKMGKNESQLAGQLMMLRNTEKMAASFRNLKLASQTTSQELASAQAKVTALAQAMRTAGAPTKQMQQQFEQAKFKAGALKNELASQQAELQRLRASLTVAGFSTREFSASEAKLRDEMAKTNAAIERQNRVKADRQAASAKRTAATQGMFSAYGSMQGAIVTAQSIASPFVAAIDNAMEFEHAMSKVKALTQSGLIREGALEQVSANMQKLEAQARELGATTQFTMTQAAEAMGYLGMAGWKTEQIYGTMPGMLSLAAGAGVDLARTADIVSDNMTAMGVPVEKAGHFMDVYAYALTNANVNLESLGETMKYAAPVAAAFGATLEDTAAMTMMMGNAGIKGSMAGTALRMGLLRLAGPPKKATKEMEALGISVSDATAMAIESQMALKSLGITMDDNAPPMEKMANVIRQLQEKTQGLSREEKLAAVSGIFGANAASGWINIIEQGAGVFEKYRNELRQCDGYSKQFEKTMNDDTRGAMISLGSAVDAVVNSLGTAFLGILRDVATYVAPLATNFAAWIKANQGIVKVIGLITIAATGAFVAISAMALAFAGFGFVSATLAEMKVAFMGLRAVTMLTTAATWAQTTATAALGTVTTALRNPLGTATMLLRGFGTQMKAAGTVAMGLPGTIGRAFVAMPGMIGGALKALPGILLSIATAGLPVILTIGAIIAVIAILAANWDYIKETATVVWNHISGTISAQVERIKATFAEALNTITAVWNSVTGNTATSSEFIMGIINNIGFTIGVAFDIAAGIVSTSISVIINLIASMAQIIGGVVNIIVGIFTGDWERVWQGAGQAVDGFVGGTFGTIKKITEGIGSMFDTLMGKASEVESKAKEAQSAAGVTGDNSGAIANAQQVAAATQETANASSAASANAQNMAVNLQNAGANAQQTSGYMQQLQAVMQNVPAVTQTAFTGMGEQSGAAVQAVQTNMAQLPPATMTNTDQMAAEFNKLTEKCTPGGEAFVQAANQWGQQAYENIANWATQMAATVTEKLMAAWSSISSQFSAGLHVNVTTSAPNVAHNALGGIYNKGAFLTTFAEDSAEAAIPLDGSRRAIDLWQKAGQMLGVIPQGNSLAGAEPDTVKFPLAMEPRGSESTSIEINMPSITIQGNADANIVSQMEGVLARMKADIMREMEKQFGVMQERNSHQERRLSYV